MTLDEAKKLLTSCYKDELRDHAFGDVEVGWFRRPLDSGSDENPNELVAGGYFGNQSSVWICGPSNAEGITTSQASFEGKDAEDLRRCFKTESIQRNDETGPEDFVQGRVMPGLTLKDVLAELTQK